MARHIADRANPDTSSRPARFAEIERAAATHPAVRHLRMRPSDLPAALRLQAFVDQARAVTEATGKHAADGTRDPAPARPAQYVEIARREGLHPAMEALHSRARDSASVARMRAFLRAASAETSSGSRHVADGPRADAPARPARYLELAHRERLHPSVRALRTRRGDSTALIRLREFLRIARGDTA